MSGSGGFDPFFAPRSGRGAEDPFGGPVARRPGNAPGGDPYAPDSMAFPAPRTEGRRSPTISIQIPTDPEGRRKDINQFQLSGDVRQLADAWSFSIPNPEGRFNYLLKMRLYPITIWESDPEVKGGEDIQQLRGVIVNISQDTGEQGSILHLSGYDLGFLLSSGAPYWYNLKHREWADIAAALIDKSWLGGGSIYTPLGQHGFRSISGIELNTRLKAGRVDAEIAKFNQEVKDLQRLYAGKQEILQSQTAHIKALMPKIQIQPGQTVSDVLTRYARLAARFVGVSALGDLMFFQPNYKQQPEYVFHWHFAADRSQWNNVESVNYTLDGEHIYNDIACVGSNIQPVLLPNKDDPNEGKFAGGYINLLAAGLPTEPFRRRLSFADDERLNKRLAESRAKWRFQQGLYDGETWTAIVPGHSQNGVPFIEGMRAEIHDTKNGIDKVMFVSRVDRMQDVVGGTGTRTRIVCKPDGLLAP